MRALFEGPDELAQTTWCGGREPLLTGDGRQREDAPAEAVGESLRIALHETVVGEHLQRARDLALLPADELGDARHAELPALVEGEQDRESAFQARCGFHVYLTIMATSVVA